MYSAVEETFQFRRRLLTEILVASLIAVAGSVVSLVWLVAGFLSYSLTFASLLVPLDLSFLTLPLGLAGLEIGWRRRRRLLSKDVKSWAQATTGQAAERPTSSTLLLAESLRLRLRSERWTVDLAALLGSFVLASLLTGMVVGFASLGPVVFSSTIFDHVYYGQVDRAADLATVVWAMAFPVAWFVAIWVNASSARGVERKVRTALQEASDSIVPTSRWRQKGAPSSEGKTQGLDALFDDLATRETERGRSVEAELRRSLRRYLLLAVLPLEALLLVGALPLALYDSGPGWFWATSAVLGIWGTILVGLVGLGVGSHRAIRRRFLPSVGPASSPGSGGARGRVIEEVFRVGEGSAKGVSLARGLLALQVIAVIGVAVGVGFFTFWPILPLVRGLGFQCHGGGCGLDFDPLANRALVVGLVGLCCALYARLELGWLGREEERASASARTLDELERSFWELS